MVSERWFLNVVSDIHLGFIGESFPRGSLIEKDGSDLIVNGRRFSDTRDLEVLKRQANNNPETPWIVSHYDSEGLAPKKKEGTKSPKKERNKMEVVTDDSTDYEPIDIGHTKIVKNEDRGSRNTHTMPIIRGDESAEERLASSGNSPEEIEKRVKVKSETPWKPRIVADGDLGDSENDGAIEDKTASQRKREIAEISSSKASQKDIDFELHPDMPLPAQSDIDSDLFDEVAPSAPKIANNSNKGQDKEVTGVPVKADLSRVVVLENIVGELRLQVEGLAKMQAITLPSMVSGD